MPSGPSNNVEMVQAGNATEDSGKNKTELTIAQDFMKKKTEDTPLTAEQMVQYPLSAMFESGIKSAASGIKKGFLKAQHRMSSLMQTTIEEFEEQK